MKKMWDMSFAELIAQFEKDVLLNEGSLSKRIFESGARRELGIKKEEALPLIQDHLKERCGSQDPVVIHAWNLILGWMQPGQTAGSTLARMLVEQEGGASATELSPLQQELRERLSAQLGGIDVTVSIRPNTTH
jgi:hypothetical protein